MIRLIKKYAIILNHRRRVQIFGIVFLMFIAGLFETAGISLIVPLVTAILENDFLDTNKFAIMVSRLLNIKSLEQFILFVLLALIIIYVVKNVFLVFEYYVQTRFVCNARYEIQTNLVKTYLSRPYEFYLNVSFGEILRVVGGDASGSFTLLTSLMTLSSEMIISAMLIFAIFVTDFFMATIVALVLGITMLLIYKGIKPLLQKASQIYGVNAALSNKWLLQSINGIKEIKVMNKESFFLEQYSKYERHTIGSEKKNTVLQNVPRLIIEMVMISGMLGMIIFLILMGYKMEELLPKLAAFALAAVRLLPSANRISSGLNIIAYHEPRLDSLIENIVVLDKSREGKHIAEKRQTYSFEQECGLESICFHYPNSDISVLDNVTMTIPKGSCVGIVGKSGEGKTTAVDILLGLLEPQAGRVLVDGIDINQDKGGWLKCLSYIPQKIFMLDDTIKANVAFGIEESEIEIQEVWRALKEACLDEFVKSLPNGLDTTIGEGGIRLSGGQRQRIGIARALYGNPQLLIFDEATSSLDNETEAAIMESINALQGNKTMVIIAHRLSTISGCDMVYRVADKKIIREK